MIGIQYGVGIKVKPAKKDIVYLEIADKISELSKDQNTKVGTVIIDRDGKVVSMGYNGCPSNFGVVNGEDDKIVPHSRDFKEIRLQNDYKFLGVTKFIHSENKYPFMLHAEQNALLTASDNSRLKGATMYCTHYPCTACALMLAQAGITDVKVLDRRHGMFDETIVPTLFTYENMGITLTCFTNSIDEKV